MMAAPMRIVYLRHLQRYALYNYVKCVPYSTGEGGDNVGSKSSGLNDDHGEKSSTNQSAADGGGKQLSVDEKESSSHSAKEEKQKTDKVSKEQLAAEKLNALLSQMKMGFQPTAPTKLPDLAKPQGQVLAKLKEARLKAERKAAAEKDVNSIGYQLKAAAKNVAISLGGDSEQTESELLQKLKRHSEETSVKKSIGAEKMSELFAGMKVEKEEVLADIPPPIIKGREEQGRLKKYRSARGSRGPPPSEKVSSHIPVERFDLFSQKPLGIFTTSAEDEVAQPSRETPTLPTWDKMYKRELKLMVTNAPINDFEEKIQWTEQGKLWHFPIDNEQGLEEETSVGFHEHVFLEPHLEPWCPKKGPVRIFMELVCVGLSKNSFLTVKEKKDHINWYRQYFEEKKSFFEKDEAVIQ